MTAPVKQLLIKCVLKAIASKVGSAGPRQSLRISYQLRADYSYNHCENKHASPRDYYDFQSRKGQVNDLGSLSMPY